MLLPIVLVSDTLSNSALEDDLRLLEDIEHESNEEHMFDRDSKDDEQESRAESLLVGAYNHSGVLNATKRRNDTEVTTYCPKCNQHMCMGTCFEKYHTLVDYKH